MSIRKTDTVMRLQKIQEGVIDEIRLIMYQSKNSNSIKSLRTSMEAIEGYHILPTMSEYNKVYLLRALFLIEGHMHRQLRERKGFRELMRELLKVKEEMMRWKDETQ